MKTYQTQGTCSRAIDYEVTEGVITACRFVGGCPGNTQGARRPDECQTWYTIRHDETGVSL